MATLTGNALQFLQTRHWPVFDQLTDFGVEMSCSNLSRCQANVNFTYLHFLLILQNTCSTPQIPCHTAKDDDVVTGTSGRGERKWWAALRVPGDWAVKKTVGLPIKLQHN